MLSKFQTSPQPIPSGFEVRELDPQNERSIIHHMRRAKDSGITDEQIRAELLRWTDDRIDKIQGYRTWALFMCEVPIGCLSAFQLDGLTRIRDLFLVPDHQGCGLSKHLLCAVMNELKPPFAVITDTDNNACYTYLKRGFKTVFIQRAFMLKH